jgi:hypothetical protein
MSPVRTVLWSRLEDKGLGRDKIPHFLRCLNNLLLFVPGADRDELNRWLNAMGWGQVDVDDETLHMVETSMQDQRPDDPDSVFSTFAY